MSRAPTRARAACLDEALAWLRARFDAEAARGLDVCYEFELSGPGGGSFAAHVADGRLELAAAPAAAADVSFRLAASDFYDVLAGCANADMLFMEERIEIKGDLALALKLRRLFRPAEAPAGQEADS
jgi:predicted lipid carrier protein YhbT